MASSPTILEQARSRARSYWRADGIPALVRGFQAMCWAAGIYLLGHGPHSGFWRHFVFWLAICLDRGVILSLKGRITYPRTGYVAPPPQFHATHDDFVLLRLNDDDLAAEPASAGPKISLVGMVALVLTAYAAFLALVSLVGPRPIVVVLGAAGLFSTLYGAAKLLIYLRRNRRPIE
jgi:hypothetical protein